jgi:ADP-heptose:LPS heptosyltransferase
VPSALFEGADVLSFWPDRDGRLAASAAASGAQSFVHLNPRPQVPPHAMEHMFAEAGLTPPEDLLEQSVLQRSGTGRGVLWLHPGSGSPAKNAPLSEFAERARHSSGPVIVSMGEVEDSEGERYRAAFADTGAELWRPTDVAELRDRLEREASGYVGNDSGPTHLAAALGIPTLALFLTTDPRIWRPAGADVRV